MINNSVGDVKLKVGDVYHIGHVLKELNKAPDVRLGHIIVLDQHLYHIDKSDLEKINTKVMNIESRGSYKPFDNKKKATDVTILAIEDPFEGFVRYLEMYKDMEGQILEGINKSKSREIGAPISGILEEAERIGVLPNKKFDISYEMIKGVQEEIKVINPEYEKHARDLFRGINIYFKRLGIDTKVVKSSEYGQYMAFIESGKIHTSTYIRCNTYEKFYRELETDIRKGISSIESREVATSIISLIDEAEKHGIVIDSTNTRKRFLDCMHTFFNNIGIATKVISSGQYISFK